MTTKDSAEAILEAAKDLFVESGYDGVNLDAVAERAGFSRQTVYNRFGSKEAVFRAMVERHWSFFDVDAQLAMPELDPSSNDAAGILRAVAEVILRFLDATGQVAFTRLVIAESRRWPWVGEEFYRLGKAPALAGFVTVLERMEAAGLIDCPHPEIAARQFLGLVQEFVIWPKVMGIGRPAIRALPPRDVVVDEAVATFLARYGRPVSRGSAGRGSGRRRPGG